SRLFHSIGRRGESRGRDCADVAPRDVIFDGGARELHTAEPCRSSHSDILDATSAPFERLLPTLFPALSSCGPVAQPEPIRFSDFEFFGLRQRCTNQQGRPSCLLLSYADEVGVGLRWLFEAGIL